jgi:hypothetical protein
MHPFRSTFNDLTSKTVISVQDAEAYFDIDEFNDLYAKAKPTLYIKMSDIFSIHQLVASEIEFMCPHPDDFLKQLVRDLGNVKSNENELMGVSSTEINLTLNPKLAQTEGMCASEDSHHRKPQLTNFPLRSGSRYQDLVHGDQAMYPLYHSRPDRSKPDGSHAQAPE